MTWLLDVNVLVALAQPAHVHHDPAEAWFAGREAGFATTPTTQGSLLRLLARGGSSLRDAQGVLHEIAARDDHDFWSDDLRYGDLDLTGLLGHRQVTDAYLAEQARRHEGLLATFDRGLVATHPDVARLVTAEPGGA